MKISDIADIINVTEKDPSNSGIDVFVGLEHYDIAEPVIKRYGSTKMLSTAAKKFEAGDVLIARRNVYLQRASVARFAGLTSGDSIVLRVKKNLDVEGTDYETMCKLLPFILNSINFWDYANTNADGTMSKRLSPAMLQDYELNLPSIDEQKTLAKKLWTAYNVKQSYLKMIDATDEMVKAQFIEMFDFENKSLYRLWGDLFETQLGKMLDKNKQNEKDTLCKYLANINVQWGYFELSELNSMTFNDYELSKYALYPNDLLICEGGDAGRCAVWKTKNSKVKYQKAIHRARPINDNIIDVCYTQYYMQYFKNSGKLGEYITKGTIEHLTGEKLNTVPVLVPPMRIQQKFVAIAEQADKSKAELHKSIDAIDKVIKSLINEDL